MKARSSPIHNPTMHCMLVYAKTLASVSSVRCFGVWYAVRLLNNDTSIDKWSYLMQLRPAIAPLGLFTHTAPMLCMGVSLRKEMSVGYLRNAKSTINIADKHLRILYG